MLPIILYILYDVGMKNIIKHTHILHILHTSINSYVSQKWFFHNIFVISRNEF